MSRQYHCKWCPSRLACKEYGCKQDEIARRGLEDIITDEVLTAAMRAFEPLSSVLRYREKDKWHTCDLMAMREALKAAFVASRLMRGPAAPAHTTTEGK